MAFKATDNKTGKAYLVDFGADDDEGPFLYLTISSFDEDQTEIFDGVVEDPGDVTQAQEDITEAVQRFKQLQEDRS